MGIGHQDRSRCVCCAVNSSHQGSVQHRLADIGKETRAGLGQVTWAKCSQPAVFVNNHLLEHSPRHSLVDYLWPWSSSVATDCSAFKTFSEKVGKRWARTQFQVMHFIELSAKDSPPTWSHLICTLLEMLITVMRHLGVLQSSSHDGN